MDVAACDQLPPRFAGDPPHRRRANPNLEGNPNMSWLLALVLSSFVGAPTQDCMIVEFTTDNCGPCQQLQPALEKLKTEGWIVRTVNATREPLMVSKFSVKSVPTLVLIANGKEVDRIVGAAPYEKILPRLASLLIAINAQPLNAALSQSTASSQATAPTRSSPAARAEQWPSGPPKQLTAQNFASQANTQAQASQFQDAGPTIRGQSPSSGAFPMLAVAASSAISSLPTSQSIADKFNERAGQVTSQAAPSLAPSAFDSLAPASLLPSAAPTSPSNMALASTPELNNPAVMPASFPISARNTEPSVNQRSPNQTLLNQSPNLQAAQPQPAQQPAPQLDLQSAIARAAAATVRIRVDEENSTAYGTGTVIDVHGDEALVLTCGHLFREMKKHSQLTIDLFPNRSQPINVPAQLIDFKADAGDEDIGLVSFRLPYAIEPVPLLPQSETLRVGQPAFSFGCDHGDNPTRRDTQVKNINRYLGAPNVEIAGAPAVGRSGGGLFDNQGRLIGVCNAADAEGDEGIYAAAGIVYNQIERLGLSHLVNNHPAASPNLATPNQLVSLQSTPPQQGNSPAVAPDSIASQMTCIVRDASGQEKIVRVDSPSPDLLNAIFRQAARK